MNEVDFLPVDARGSQELARFAHDIWREYYAAILSAEQIDYMLSTYHSSQSIASQISLGYEYYYILYNVQAAGYMALAADDEGLFLSKFYIRHDYRRRGIGRRALAFAAQRGRLLGAKKIHLTVNRENSVAIAAYTSYGFAITREQNADIGSGYFMTDYVMSMDI